MFRDVEREERPVVVIDLETKVHTASRSMREMLASSEIEGLKRQVLLGSGVQIDDVRELILPSGRRVRCFIEDRGAFARLVVDCALSGFDELLTKRENEVLEWISEGKRDAEIAAILGCAPKTVGKHVEHILEKLGVETRTAATRVVFKRQSAGD